jgi:membrane protease YdiL (CAAX protease family)
MQRWTLLVSPHHHRLRSGWRVALFVAMLLLPRLLLSLLALVDGDPPTVPDHSAPASQGPPIEGSPSGGRGATISPDLAGIFTTSMVAAWILFVSWVCLRRIDGERLASLGLGLSRRWARELGRGMAAGAGMIAIVVLIQVVAGGTQLTVHPQWRGWWTDLEAGVGLSRGETLSPLLLELMLTIGFLFASALYEELLYRGYAFQTLLRDLSPVVPIGLLSLFFALGHWQNPGRDLFSTLNTVLAGIWLSLAYLQSRSLWYPLGLHFAWNWTLGPVFGLPVSGLRIPLHPILEATSGSPDWLTGGAYGSEGGAAASLVLLLAIAWLVTRLQLLPTAADGSSFRSP